MNKIILIGRLTQDLTCQYTSNQTPFVKGSVAVQRDFKNQDGTYDTDFINFIAYRQLAELIVKHFNKGDKIGIVGSLQIDKWQDQQGQTRTTPCVQVKEIEFLQEKKEAPTYDEKPTEAKEFEVEEDDLPF